MYKIRPNFKRPKRDCIPTYVIFTTVMRYSISKYNPQVYLAILLLLVTVGSNRNVGHRNVGASSSLLSQVKSVIPLGIQLSFRDFGVPVPESAEFTLDLLATFHRGPPRAVSTWFVVPAASAWIRMDVFALTFRLGRINGDGGGDWKNASAREVLHFFCDFLMHVEECGFETGEFDFSLVDVLEKLVVSVYLFPMVMRCLWKVAKALL